MSVRTCVVLGYDTLHRLILASHLLVSGSSHRASSDVRQEQQSTYDRPLHSERSRIAGWSPSRRGRHGRQQSRHDNSCVRKRVVARVCWQWDSHKWKQEGALGCRRYRLPRRFPSFRRGKNFVTFNLWIFRIVHSCRVCLVCQLFALDVSIESTTYCRSWSVCSGYCKKKIWLRF